MTQSTGYAVQRHTGRAIVEEAHGLMLLLCPYRHIVTAINAKDWAGSFAEAYWPPIVTCEGALPPEPKEGAQS